MYSNNHSAWYIGTCATCAEVVAPCIVVGHQ